MADPIRVLFVAEHQMVKDSFKLLIGSSDDLVVVAMTSEDIGVAPYQFKSAPEVAVISLAKNGSVDLIATLLDDFPDLRIVVIVPSDELDLQAQALELGAVGIVHKDQNPALLLEAIRQTHSGETWLNQVVLNKLLQRKKSDDLENGTSTSKFDSSSGFETLTNRELEVLDLIGTGLKNKEIAEKLQISEPTVRCHLSSIYGKLGVKDRLNLVIKAYQIGLLEI
ncbi:MAG: response regulator transcription factor [Aridibacter famidurans]|nr:response regulator transcription factor [Aridibacter famidurans]